MLGRVVLAAALLCIAPCGRGATPVGWSGSDLYGVPCHGLYVGYGPFDYNDPLLQKRAPGSPLYLVESFHYTKHVRELMPGIDPGNSTANDDNLAYVLRAFPNHHEALWTMIHWYLNGGRPRAAEIRIPPAECWLQRAIAFRPKDPVVYMLYGIYLQLAGFPGKATSYYEKSLAINPRSAEAHYNYGLALVEKHRYKDAVAQAKLAYKLGYPLPGLRDRLRQVGYSLEDAR